MQTGVKQMLSTGNHDGSTCSFLKPTCPPGNGEKERRMIPRRVGHRVSNTLYNPPFKSPGKNGATLVTPVKPRVESIIKQNSISAKSPGKKEEEKKHPVIPFISFNGMSGNSEQVKEQKPDARVLDGLRIHGIPGGARRRAVGHLTGGLGTDQVESGSNRDPTTKTTKNLVKNHENH